MKDCRDFSDKPTGIPVGFLIELSETNNQRDVLETFARWARVMIDCDRVAVLLDGENGYFKCWSVEHGAIVFREETFQKSETTAGKFFREGHCAIVNDLAAIGTHDTAFAANLGLKAAIYAPIFCGTKIKGMIVASYRSTRDDLLEDQLIVETLGRSLGTYMLLHDQVNQLSQEVITDPLTGLRNRRYLEEIVRASLKDWHLSQQHFALLLFDIDHFKRVNDTHGHDVGDVVLKRVGETLTSVSRQTDSVVRMGGEEFCILMRGARLNEVTCIAERTRRSIEGANIFVEDKTIRITVSIGTASVEQGFNSFGSLLKAADEALYQAKRDGRNKVRLARPPDVVRRNN